MRKYVFILVAVSIMVTAISCRTNSRKNPYINTMNLQPSSLAMMDTSNYTTIEFEKLEYDFRKLKSGDSIKHDFKFTNTGKTPLFINSIISECGCTVSKYSKDPVFPGESDTIKILFNSFGQKGIMHKTITVETNTLNASTHILALKGEVVDVVDEATYKPITQ